MDQPNLPIIPVEEQFKIMADTAPVMIWISGIDKLCYFFNTGWLNFTGRTPEEEQGNGWAEGVHPDDLAKCLDIYISSFDARKEFRMEYRLRRHDGQYCWLLDTGVPRYAADGTFAGYIGSCIDIDEQVKARKKVEQAEEMLRFALQAANIGTWLINITTGEFKTTPILKSLFGYEASADMTYAQILEQITVEYRDKIISSIKEAANKGGSYDITYSMHRFNDQKLIWLRSLGKLIQDEKGELSIFSGVVMDITEQKEDEQRKNDFIGMVSHELKTPLTSLSGYLQILNSQVKKAEDELLNDILRRAGNQVRKMSKMINGFLNLTRLESGKIYLEKEEFMLDELIRELIEETRISVSSHTISFSRTDRVKIDADQEKIGSVISNLLSNAVKYSPRGINVEVTCEKLANNTVQVSIRDEGMGIKSTDIGKLFDRFYRIDSKQTENISGFGIGLYLSAEIINRHGGKIDVTSQIGKGSTFSFILPLSS